MCTTCLGTSFVYYLGIHFYHLYGCLIFIALVFTLLSVWESHLFIFLVFICTICVGTSLVYCLGIHLYHLCEYPICLLPWYSFDTFVWVPHLFMPWFSFVLLVWGCIACVGTSFNVLIFICTTWMVTSFNALVFSWTICVDTSFVYCLGIYLYHLWGYLI